jgi:tetratricopeptide (TPR) repeat protein
MAQKLERDLTYNAEAIGLLEGLCDQAPAEAQNSTVQNGTAQNGPAQYRLDQYRLELARNHRDRMRLSRLLGNRLDFEKSFAKATELFQDLLQKSPNSAVLKYDLANLYSGSLQSPSVDGIRLDQALKLIQEVLGDHPSVPEYQTLYASLLARSAWAQPFANDTQSERQFERIENGIAKLQQSIAIHQGLVDRFPEIPLYGINLLQTKVQLVEFNMQFRRPEKAKQSLSEATALAEKMLESGAARQPVVRAILERLRERKIALETRPESEKP